MAKTVSLKKKGEIMAQTNRLKISNWVNFVGGVVLYSTVLLFICGAAHPDIFAAPEKSF